MYIYNVTVNIQEDVHDEWVKWMRTEHIPQMLNTGKFSKALMTRVMVQEEMGGMTYSTQYTTENKEMLADYYRENAPELRVQPKLFEGKMVVFRTEMQVVEEAYGHNNLN